MIDLAINNGIFSTVDELNKEILNTGCFTLENQITKFDCFYKSNQSSEYLFVCLSGARNSSSILPHFNRWSWGETFDANILCISDPSYYLDPENLNLAWYIGYDQFNCIDYMASLINKVITLNGVEPENVILYGSSGGGFAALKLIDKLNYGVAVVINPQTNILKYYEQFYTKFLQICFKNEQSIFSNMELMARLNVFNSLNNTVKYKIIYAQNVVDLHHYRYHYLPYCQVYDLIPTGGIKGHIETILYDSENGHGAEPKDLAIQLITKAKKIAQTNQSINFMKSSLIRNIEISSERIDHLQIELKANNKTPVVFPFDKEFIFFAHGRDDLPVATFKFPINWSKNLYNDRNWLFQLNIWRIFDNNIRAFEDTKDSQYLIFPKNIILDWYREHFIQKRKNPYTLGDMVVGGRAMRLAYIISQFQHGYLHLNDYEQKCFSELIEFHLDFLLDIKNIAFSNHTLTDVQGMAALAQIVDLKTYERIFNFLDSIMPKLIRSQFNENFIHVENSPEYHPFGIKCLKNLHQTGWFEKYNLEKIIKEAQKITDNFVMPDGRIIPFGDSTAVSQKDAVTKIAYKGKQKIFNNSGYFIYRYSPDNQVRNASMLAVMGALNSRFHKQCDDLSCIWFEGEDILVDVGKYAYKTNEKRAYAVSTRAHNTIDIDGDNYYLGNNISNEQIFGNAINSITENHGYIIVDAMIHRRTLSKNKDVNISHKRKLIYAPNKFLCFVDYLVSRDEHVYTQWFHVASKFQKLSIQNDVFKGTSLLTNRPLKIMNPSKDVETILNYGNESPELQGWVGRSYGELEPASAVGYRKKGKKVLLVTLISLQDKPYLAKRNDIRYILRDGDKKNIISIRDDCIHIQTLD